MRRYLIGMTGASGKRPSNIRAMNPSVLARNRQLSRNGIVGQRVEVDIGDDEEGALLRGEHACRQQKSQQQRAGCQPAPPNHD